MPGYHRPTVYYDGACPLCAREVGFYRRQNGSDRICWVDISDIDTMDVAPDLARKEALARFTVRNADGSLVSGGRAFTPIWKQLPRFRWLAKLFDVQPFAWSLDQAYDIFLKLRPRLQVMALSRKVRGPRR
jgi:predicted DCC family thiol-disulfide oxidoreductase YuxK